MKELSTFVLENGALSVRVSPVGAELQSVVCGGVERMWSGDPAVWGRRAPLLFPLIGRLRDGWYANGGRRVDAPMHGFCRDRLFSAEQVSDVRVRFETASDERIRAVYPFDFRLTVDFTLEGSSIVKSHTVENLGDVPLPFELGGHEAYATRLMPGERMVDCFVRFEDIDKLEMFGMDEAGILTLPKIEVPLEDGRLTRTPEQLGIDTVVLENVPGSVATLGSSKSGYEWSSPISPIWGFGRKPAKAMPATCASSPGPRCPTHASPHVSCPRSPACARLRPGSVPCWNTG